MRLCTRILLHKGTETHITPANFQTGEKCAGTNILASVHTMPEQFENGRKLNGNKLVGRI